ncbi:MAG: DUF3800 domain-containing protein [Ignavibacteria bacterium]|nr:DUF3800 domain-containing protein [Ignavibacteria bacterium]
MAYILFIDESGSDLRESPYEVIAGVAIEDKDVWNLICDVHLLEEKFFGRRYSEKSKELKAKKLLKRKTFKQASQAEVIPNEKRRLLAKECLDNGNNASKEHLTALAQAKLEFIKELLLLLTRNRAKIFASITSSKIVKEDNPNFLRKDFVYLFERFYYYIECQTNQSGIIVFDETEKSRCHTLISQIENYFKKTEKGQTRAGLLIPEPLFVHSDLTTGIQFADIIAYLISWAFRIKEMEENHREELLPFIELIKPMRFRTSIDITNNSQQEVWSVVFLG